LNRWRPVQPKCSTRSTVAPSTPVAPGNCRLAVTPDQFNRSTVRQGAKIIHATEALSVRIRQRRNRSRRWLNGSYSFNITARVIDNGCRFLRRYQSWVIAVKSNHACLLRAEVAPKFARYPGLGILRQLLLCLSTSHLLEQCSSR